MWLGQKFLGKMEKKKETRFDIPGFLKMKKKNLSRRKGEKKVIEVGTLVGLC